MVISGATQATYHPNIAQGRDNQTLKAVPTGFQVPARTLTFGQCHGLSEPLKSRESSSFGSRVIDFFSGLVSMSLTKISDVVVSLEDEATLKKHINKNTVAFIVTPHPEYFTDAQVDKKLANKFFPEASFMMDASFFKMPVISTVLRSANVRPNNGGKEGLQQAVDCAMEGTGFLLKFEGGVTGKNDKIHAGLPGAADMAIEAYMQSKAAGDNRKIYIVPNAWKYVFDGDISPGLQKHMAFIEKKMNLPSNSGLSLPDRFAKLQINILKKLMCELRKTESLPKSLEDIELSNSNFFFVRAELLKQYKKELDALVGKRYGQDIRLFGHYEKELDKYSKLKTKEGKETYQKLNSLFQAFKHLKGLDEEVYNTSTLTQEHLFESLLRIRRYFELNAIPFLPDNAPGPRKAYVRVGEPIDVRDFVAKGSKNPWFRMAELRDEVQTSMQDAIDDLNRSRELRVKMSRFRVANRLGDTPRVREL